MFLGSPNGSFKLEPYRSPPQCIIQVFYNVDVFDGYHILRGRTVTVQDGMIRSVMAAGVRPPESAVVIDGAGRTLLPGLIDAHVHIGGHAETLEQAAALGLTTVLDMW